MGSQLLLLRLEGPLQSWGLRSRWDVRDTGDEPGKSGVIGLLGCALGLPVGAPHLEELEEELTMAVRVERPGIRLVDFQTITGELPTADGGKKGKPEDPSTVISPRACLQDAAFLVVLDGPSPLLEELAVALQRPRWPVFLGRKSCPPTRPVFETLTDQYESVGEALRKHPWSGALAGDEDLPPKLRCIVESSNGKYLRPDRVRTNPARMYASRTVEIYWVARPPGA